VTGKLVTESDGETGRASQRERLAPRRTISQERHTSAPSIAHQPVASIGVVINGDVNERSTAQTGGRQMIVRSPQPRATVHCARVTVIAA
jgi:hypothetical protein